MTPRECPKCGAPAGPSAPDGDFRYRAPVPSEAEEIRLRRKLDEVSALLVEADAVIARGWSDRNEGRAMNEKTFFDAVQRALRRHEARARAKKEPA